ncbi:MAG: AAA family ATPase [Promethearchaeota archaeon]
MILKRKKIVELPKTKTLTMLVGIPGTGKSTLAKKMMETCPQGRVIVSSDEIRFNMLNYSETGVDFDPTVEARVWNLIESSVKNVIAASLTKEIVLDATNVRRSNRSKFIKIAKENGIKTRAIVLYKPLEEVKEQNMSRKRIVPDDVIENFFDRFQPPTKDEFDTIINIGSRRKFKTRRKKSDAREPILKINGHDVMTRLNLPQGKQIGIIIKKLKEAVFNGNIKNKRKILLKELDKF